MPKPFHPFQYSRLNNLSTNIKLTYPPNSSSTGSFDLILCKWGIARGRISTGADAARVSMWMPLT